LGQNFVKSGRADIRGRGGRNNIQYKDIRTPIPYGSGRVILEIADLAYAADTAAVQIAGT